MRLATFFLLLLSWSSTARAQDEGAEELVPASGSVELAPAALLDHRFGEARDGRSERLHAWASFALGGGWLVYPAPMASLATELRAGEAIVISPSLGARFALTESIDASLEWNFAYAATRVNGAFTTMDASGTHTEPFELGREALEAGNPVMQVAFTHDWSVLSIQVAPGVAFPVAAVSQAARDVPGAADRAASLFVHEWMLAMHGALDPWRFLPERLAIVVPVRIALGDRIGGAIEVAGAWTIPVLGAQAGSRSEGALQIAGDVGVEILPELRAGLRGSIVGWRLGRPDGPARMQGALEPWVRATFGAVHGVLRATLDLGGDYGLGTPSGVWAIHIGGGGTIDHPDR